MGMSSTTGAAVVVGELIDRGFESGQLAPSET
jgi:hypothetical protein